MQMLALPSNADMVEEVSPFPVPFPALWLLSPANHHCLEVQVHHFYEPTFIYGSFAGSTRLDFPLQPLQCSTISTQG